MNDVADPIVVIVVVGLLIEMVWSLRSAHWMRQRYGRRLMSSAVWDRLIEGQIRSVVATLLLMLVVVHGFGAYALNIEPPIPRPWPSVIVSIAMALLLYGPIADKRMMQAIERGELEPETRQEK